MTTMDKIMQAVDELKNMALVEQYGDTDDLELSAQIEDVRDLTASAIADAQREWVDAIESVGWGRDLHPQEVAARILGMAESHNRMQAAIADARREGAEQLRGACLRGCCEIEGVHRVAYRKKYDAHAEGASDGAADCAAVIRALPLPTGERQAVLLTDEIKQACSDIAAEVAKNCGSVPQLTFPHIYLGVTTLLEKARVCRG